MPPPAVDAVPTPELLYDPRPDVALDLFNRFAGISSDKLFVSPTTITSVVGALGPLWPLRASPTCIRVPEAPTEVVLPVPSDGENFIYSEGALLAAGTFPSLLLCVLAMRESSVAGKSDALRMSPVRP